MNTVKKTGGFTLVELIIVIAILAILSSVAVAGYSSYIKKANDSAVNTYLSNLSQHIVLANAEGGGIASITYTVATAEGGAKTITATVVVENAVADDFAKDFAFTSGTFVDGTEGDKNFTVTGIALPSQWDASSYPTATKIEWKGGKVDVTLPNT